MSTRPKTIDVARYARVSAGTVSNVLHRPDIVAPNTLQRVREAIDALGYQPVQRGMRPSPRDSRIVCAVATAHGSWYWREVIRGAEDEAIDSGVVVLQGHVRDVDDDESHLLDVLENSGIRGIIAAPNPQLSSRLTALADRGIRSVLVDHRDSEGRLPSVDLDNVGAGRAAAAHLLASGYRDILFVGDTASSVQVRERMDGARRVVESYAGEVSIKSIAFDARATEQLEGTFEGIDPARPRAIIAEDDTIALQVLHFLLARGVDVPGQVGVIGFDDNPITRTAALPITTMRAPARAIGHAAMRHLLRDETDEIPDQIIFSAELVARDSTSRSR